MCAFGMAPVPGRYRVRDVGDRFVMAPPVPAFVFGGGRHHFFAKVLQLGVDHIRLGRNTELFGAFLDLGAHTHTHTHTHTPT